MAIDLTERIIQPTPPKKAVKLHPRRRIAQVLCGVTLVALPFVNGLRLDVRAGKFWVLDQTYTAQNIFLLFFAVAISVVALLGVSMAYGRWWCGWVCPQTLASDFGDSLKERIDKFFKAKRSKTRRVLSVTTWGALMLTTAVATAATVATYFYNPYTVWRSVVHPGVDGGITLFVGIGTAIVGADLLWVRRNFCKRGCPYGLMLSLIGDKNTMTVRYLWERGDDCITCGQCVTVCPMGIDIKDGPNQMECIGCGECIDACNDILPMLKTPKAGLIELRYGVDPMRKMERLTLRQKLGLWDGKRVFVFGVLAVLGIGLLLKLYGTSPTSLTLVPSGAIIVGPAFVREDYQLIVTNGRPSDTDYAISADGMPGVAVLSPIDAVRVPRSGERHLTLTLAAPRAGLLPQTRYPVRVVARPVGDAHEIHAVPAIFYVPATSSQDASKGNQHQCRVPGAIENTSATSSCRPPRGFRPQSSGSSSSR